TVGDLAAGSSKTLNITATVDASGTYVNYAEVATADQTDVDSTPGNDSTTEDDDATAGTAPGARIDLSLTKTVSPTTYAVGSSVTFAVTVTNAAGVSNATGVTVEDFLPSGYTYVSHSGSGTYVPATGLWTVGDLTAGSSKTLNITATVDASGTYVNYAEVATADQTDVDSTPGNDSTTEDDDATAGTAPGARIDLSLTKTVSPTSYTVGSSVAFAVTVTNAAGFSNATGVTVEDFLPSGYTYVSHSGSGTYVPATGLWTVGDLAAGSSKTLNITATVDASGTYVNYAEVATADQTDVDSTPGNDSTTEDDDATAGGRPASSGGGTGSGSSDTLAPVPEAGSDQTVCLGERVCVDASASYDPDETAELSFLWSFAVLYVAAGVPVYSIPLGSQVVGTLEGANTQVACFRPDKPGDYALEVAVTDSQGTSRMDRVTIRVQECRETHTCWYEEGWNLLSLSAQPIDPAASSVIRGLAADAGPFDYLDGRYQESDVMTPTGGYWIRLVSPDAISILGREVQNDVEVRLDSIGWHLISSPFPISWERVTVLIDGVEWAIGEETARRFVDDFCACYDSELNVYRIPATILPCLGHWIRTREPNVIIRLRWDARSDSSPSGECAGDITNAPPLPPRDANTPSKATAVATPNPVREGPVHFDLQGVEGATAIRVQVYDLSGGLIWVGEENGTELDWEPQQRDGGDLARGPYVYCVFYLVEATWIRVGCAVLFVLQ
ncbi:MAG: hypothetical protein PHU43_07935, partial [Candidatus Bipolaricaulis sp.]|nr:hypothetical protein [Candidatus Bipolaricaulis sp.]